MYNSHSTFPSICETSVPRSKNISILAKGAVKQFLKKNEYLEYIEQRCEKQRNCDRTKSLTYGRNQIAAKPTASAKYVLIIIAQQLKKKACVINLKVSLN